MTMTRHLGFRSVWEDAMCIVQDDFKDVSENVDRMHRICQGARIILVAAAGQYTYDGLPGISLSRPNHQHRAHVKGLTIVNMLESAQGAIEFTRWNMRGWAYQERLLFRRLSVFTTSQVFYQCDQGCNFEEQYQFMPDSGYKHKFHNPLATLDFGTRDLWEALAITVAEYSRWSLTDPNDRLPAMNGILKYLEEPFRRPFFFGIPSTLFDVGLLWKPVGHYTRNDSEFPSWSWAGWHGAIHYETTDSMNNMCECVVSQAEIEPLAKNDFFVFSNHFRGRCSSLAF